jgi:hypothetical protein
MVFRWEIIIQIIIRKLKWYRNKNENSYRANNCQAKEKYNKINRYY